MSETPTRREVLKATAVTGTAGTIIARRAGATSAPTVRTVEAGLYYDLEIEDNYSWSRLDSRPQFTIDDRRKELVLANRTSKSRESNIIDAGALFDEQPVQKSQSATVGPSNRQVETLPTELSTRMRPMEGVSLSSAHRLPQIRTERNGETPRIMLPSGTVELESGTNQEIQLDTQTVEVTTVRVTDEKVPIEGRPEHRWGPKREYDSVEVEATPVVKVVDHGNLTVTRRELP
jgi:hypothetical protein